MLVQQQMFLVKIALGLLDKHTFIVHKHLAIHFQEQAILHAKAIVLDYHVLGTISVIVLGVIIVGI
jgi:hypothetical protein